MSIFDFKTQLCLKKAGGEGGVGKLPGFNATKTNNFSDQHKYTEIFMAIE